MRGSRFTEERIIAISKEHAEGLGTAELCRKHGISLRGPPVRTPRSRSGLRKRVFEQCAEINERRTEQIVNVGPLRSRR